MTTSTLRTVSGFVLPLTLLLALSGCGSSGSSGPVVCNASSGGSCPNPGMGPEILYAANWTNGNISGYSISPTSGALTSIPGSPFGSDITTLAADPSGKFLYVGTSLGTLDFDINSGTGALTPGVVGISNDGSLWLTIVQLPSSAAQ